MSFVLSTWETYLQKLLKNKSKIEARVNTTLPFFIRHWTITGKWWFILHRWNLQIRFQSH